MDWLLIVITALLSSSLTLAGAILYYRFWLLPQVDATLAKTLEEFGKEIEQRVKRGIHEGVATLPSADLIKQTQRSVTQTAGDLVKDSLGTILGSRGSKPD